MTRKGRRENKKGQTRHTAKRRNKKQDRKGMTTKVISKKKLVKENERKQDATVKRE